MQVIPTNDSQARKKRLLEYVKQMKQIAQETRAGIIGVIQQNDLAKEEAVRKNIQQS